MLEFLNNLFVQPLMEIYAFVFGWFNNWLSAGASIIAFSIVLNLALTPLYGQMERRSRQARTKREQVAREVERIKRHFSGRERYYYVRTVHRQHGYRPISELLGSADLFVQIAVFITVFHFLSDLEVLHGASFGPIADLGKPDHLLGPINFLPLLMTAINIGSVLAYVQERNKRIQAIVLAFVFMVLLYGSASGLVIYWTMNNLFSLVRNLLRAAIAKQGAGSIGRKLAEIAEQC